MYERFSDFPLPIFCRNLCHFLINFIQGTLFVLLESSIFVIIFYHSVFSQLSPKCFKIFLLGLLVICILLVFFLIFPLIHQDITHHFPSTFRDILLLLYVGIKVNMKQFLNSKTYLGSFGYMRCESKHYYNPQLAIEKHKI